jgi:hypothetical protein
MYAKYFRIDALNKALDSIATGLESSNKKEQKEYLKLYNTLEGFLKTAHRQCEEYQEKKQNKGNADAN